MVKMICLDLDGTLLRSDKTISRTCSDYLNKLIDDGIILVIATGRHYDYAKYLTRSLSEDRYIISNNGAGIFDVSADQTLVDFSIDIKLIDKFIKLARDNSLNPVIYVNALKNDFDIYISDDSNIDDMASNLVTDRSRISLLAYPYREIDALALVIHGPLAKLKAFESYIDRTYGDIINCHIMESVYGKDGLLEIMDFGVHKWSSIKKLANKLNISDGEIIAFGDQINDLEMIRHAGIGVAMKNGKESLKLYADLVSEYDNDNDGVYRQLKSILEDE